MVKVFPFIIILSFLIIAGAWFFTRGARSTGNEQEAQQQAAAFLSAFGDVPNQAIPESGGIPGLAEPKSSAPITNTNQPANEKRIMTATLRTNRGDITIEFMGNDAPNTVANFTKLAREGFYNGTKFHRVISGFMIQGGDPLSRDDAESARWGTGGPGYSFNDEIHASNKNAIGTISMANSGPNTNGSQFFINVANNNFLDGKHTVFGKVTSGMDVVTTIEKTATSAGDRPSEPVVIESISLK